MVTLPTYPTPRWSYFMQHPGQILTADQIRDRLWDLNSEAVSNVVAAQVGLLRRKLAQLDSNAEIETLRGLGYRLTDKTPADFGA